MRTAINWRGGKATRAVLSAVGLLVMVILDVSLEILHEVVGETSGEILELEVMPDHVHVLVEIDPQYGIAKLVRNMKGRSSRLLRQELPWLKSRIPTLWTNSYFVSTVGGAPMSVVKQYIENQKNV